MVSDIKTIKKSFYIYNTPGEYVFTPRTDGLYKITVVGGGGGGYGGGGFFREKFPYQSAGGGGGGTAIGVMYLQAGIEYGLTVGSGGSGGSRSIEPDTMNRGQNGEMSDFAGQLSASGGAGGCHHTQEGFRLSGRGGEAWGGDKNICGGDGQGGYYLVGEKAYLSAKECGGSSTHGDGGKTLRYRQLRQRGIPCGGADGLDGTGYGAGGGGAGFYSYALGGFKGGSGSCGLIIIEQAKPES